MSAHVWLLANGCVHPRLPQSARPSRSALAPLPRDRFHSPASAMSRRSAQPAGKRAQVRGGGGDASDGACVVHARVPMHYVRNKTRSCVCIHVQHLICIS